MASMTDIVNMAITRLDLAQQIQSVEENTPIALRARSLWDNTLECVLVEHNWNFARKTAPLARLAVDPKDWAPLAWNHAFQKPVDCLAVRRLGPWRCDDARPCEYEIGGLGKTVAIFCDVPDAAVVYTARVTETYHFPPHFVSALAYRLAAEMSMAVQASAERYSSALQAYALILAQAMKFDSRQAKVHINNDGPWMEARR